MGGLYDLTDVLQEYGNVLECRLALSGTRTDSGTDIIDFSMVSDFPRVLLIRVR